MQIELCPSNLTRCHICRLTVRKGTPRVIRDRHFRLWYYHLDCYQPDVAAPMNLQGFAVTETTDSTLVEKLTQRVKAWNSQFVVGEGAVPAQYLANAVCTTSTLARRRLMETFAYLTVGEVETVAACVCKEWLHVSRDEELWKTRFITDFAPRATEAQGDYRRKYIAYQMGACWNCKRVLRLEEIERNCPLHKKPICKKCTWLQECAIVTVTDLVKTRLVCPSTLRLLQVPEFDHRRTKSCYLQTAIEKLVQHASKRRELLIRAIIAKHPIRFWRDIQEIEAMDLERFYRGLNRVSKMERLAADFFGRNEKIRKAEKDVERFLDSLDHKYGY